MGVGRTVNWQYEANIEKKIGVGGIVDQNSDKKDCSLVLIMLNSRLRIWGSWWKKMGFGRIVE